MLRTVFFYLVAGPWTLLLMVIGLVIGLLPRTGTALLWIARDLWAPVWLWAAGVHLRVTGVADQLDAEASFVFVSNHASYFDIPATIRALRHYPRFVAKKELLFIPLLGLYIWRTGCPIIDRSDRQQAVRMFDKAIEKIRAGTPILVYAEGTRTRDGRVAPFKRGAWILAIRAGVPVVPIAVRGSYHVMKRKSWSVRSGEIHVHVDEPIPTDGLTLDDRHELSDRVREIIVRRVEGQPE